MGTWGWRGPRWALGPQTTDRCAFFQEGDPTVAPFSRGPWPWRGHCAGPTSCLSQHPTESLCLRIRKSMASLSSRGKAFSPGWGWGGSFREAGHATSPTPVLRTLEAPLLLLYWGADVRCWIDSRGLWRRGH